MLDARDMRGLVRLAQVAEEAGFDAVMVSEQTMLSGDAARNGLMSNPRMYAAIGNQDPRTPWPSSVATLAAVAAATQRVRIVAGAIIPPLRHPLLLAKDLATVDLLCEGRLVVQPTVSWQQSEYDAHGVPFHRRGAILDEHLAAMSALWSDSPAEFHGEFFDFADVYSEPKSWRPRRADDVVRRGADAPGPGTPDRALRLGLPSLRGPHRRGPGGPGRGPGERGPRPGRARAGRRNSRHLRRPGQRGGRRAGHGRLSRTRSRAASPRSA